MWTPHPDTVDWREDFGRGNLGLIEEPTSRKGRYSLPVKFCVVGFQMMFGDVIDADSATGSATLTMYNDTKGRPMLEDLGSSSTELVPGVYWIQDFASVGVSQNRLNFTAAPHRFMSDLQFEAGREVLFTWANPEGVSETLLWAIRIGMAPIPPAETELVRG